MDKKTLTVACMSFFGKKPGQSLPDFNNEVKALTQKDRNELAEMFKSAGICEIVPLAGHTEV